MEVLPCSLSRGKESWGNAVQTAVLGLVKVFLCCLRLEAACETNCLCFVPFLRFFLTSVLRLNSPKLIQTQLAICGRVQWNQRWYTVLLPVSNQITITQQQQEKPPQDLLLKTKVSSRVCQDSFPLPSPALNHETLSLVFAFKPSHKKQVLLSLERSQLKRCFSLPRGLGLQLPIDLT